MDKLKDMIKLSDRDKQLLLIVGAVLIVFLSYFFGFQKLNDANTVLEAKKNNLVKTEKDLREKNDNKDKYINDTRTYTTFYVDIMDDYENGSTQPSQIDFLNKIESVTSTWVSSAAFSAPAVIYNFGIKQTSNPNSTANAYASDNVGYKTTLSISFEASYENFKKMIDYINTYYTKNTIDEMTVTYNEGTDTVAGSVELSMYSITGADRAFTEPKFSVDTGVSNVFSNVKKK